MTSTTLIEIKPPIIYEPTVDDKVQRIIYRLEHGEELVKGTLRNRHGNFCVLGLFAEESGLGEWEMPGQCYNVDGEINFKFLNNKLVQYYNFISGIGTFKVDYLPDQVKSELESVLIGPTSSLATLNDCFVGSKPGINKLFADIIRSGVVFLHPEDRIGD